MGRREEAWRPASARDRSNGEARRRGGGIGAESARKLAPRRASQAPALESEREIEIILIRSDSACQ